MITKPPKALTSDSQYSVYIKSLLTYMKQTSRIKWETIETGEGCTALAWIDDDISVFITQVDEPLIPTDPTDEISVQFYENGCDLLRAVTFPNIRQAMLSLGTGSID